MTGSRASSAARDTERRTPDPAGAGQRRSAQRGSRQHRSGRATGQRWARQLHTWLSTTSLLVVLFFATTGITLNHPTWFGASSPHVHSATGTLPGSTFSGGVPDPLAISEYLRSKAGVTGQVTAHAETASGGTIDYEGPGSVTSATYTTSTGAFSVATTTYGLVGMLNDLHKGRNTGASFGWLIDASGILLTLVALTGLALQLYIRRHRRLGLTLAGIGALALVALMLLNR